MTYYLGTLGALTALPDPEVGLPLTVERIGGSHQLLSGAKVRDTIGYSRSWQLSWTAITLAQYGLLEGFYYGATGAGPFYFLDDEQTNLLPLNVSTGTDTTKDTTGFTRQLATAIVSTTNANTNWNGIGGPFPANGTQTLSSASPSGLAPGAALVTGPNIPVVAGAAYTLSAYLRNDATTTVGSYAEITWRDGSLATVSASTGNTIAATVSGRTVASGTAPAGAVYGSLVLRVAGTTTTTSFVYSDGYQFEMNASASVWQPGVPMPLVTVESLSRSTPLAGICDAQMTLVQVG